MFCSIDEFDSSRRQAMLCGLPLRHGAWRRRSADVEGSCNTQWWNFGYHKMRETSWLDEELLASEGRSFAVEWRQRCHVVVLRWAEFLRVPYFRPWGFLRSLPTVRDHTEEHVTVKAWVPPVDMDLLHDHCRVCLLTRNLYWLIQTISTTGLDTWFDPWFLFHLSLTQLLS
jgi:hypothetical protein